jgi:hypothetical protein
MDEIFLRDYANNVAMAQQPTGLSAIQVLNLGSRVMYLLFLTIDQQPQW